MGSNPNRVFGSILRGAAEIDPNEVDPKEIGPMI